MAIHYVVSPLPGTFYRSPAPGQPAFKNEGDSVQAGEVLGLIEVMKQFTELTAEAAGTVRKFHVANEGAIDAGSPLVDIETA